MIAPERNCLDPEALKRVASGQYPAEEFDAALVHLDDCSTCRQQLEAFERDGMWLRGALIGDVTDPLQAETACQVALWQMLETPASSSVLPPIDSVPQDVLGPYRLIRALGAGGMGTVYLAEHQRLQRQCAIKLLPRERVDQPGWLDRFDREMTTIASLEHPNVVRATDAGHQDGWHYLVMEHLDGMDLGRIASRMGPLQVADACELVRQAALGLAHIHSSGLVHRDVKPSNMMLTRDGVVKLLDLGLVLSGDDPLAVDDRLTTVGHLMGTMPYVAPEQLVDSRDVSPRADIYALGATLFRLIAGRPPHQRRGGLAQHVMAITNEDPPRLDSVREDVDRDVVELVASMLSRDPKKRPQHAADIAQQLEKFARQNTVRRLLRQALRKPASSEEPRSLLTVGQAAPSTPDQGTRLWIWGLAAALVLFAGFVLKIATDRGELVVKGEGDVVIAIRQGNELVDRLEIKTGEDNRLSLHKGTYEIEIENPTGMVMLDKNVVTIGRGTTSPVDLLESKSGLPGAHPTRMGDGGNGPAALDPTINPTAANPLVKQSISDPRPAGPLLFQGKVLEEWMDLLKREQDPKSLGQVMRAVEALTRENDRRREAAESTLLCARRLGGIVSSGTGDSQFGEEADPSPKFMAFLLEVFPNYGADPGLTVLADELHEGNIRSRCASIWLLNNTYHHAERFIESDPRAERTLVKLLDGLRIAVTNSSADDLNGFPFTMARAMGLRLCEQLDIQASQQPWLAKMVIDEIDRAEQVWNDGNPIQDPAGAMYGMGQHWVISASEIQVGIDLDTAGQYDAPWNFFAAATIEGNFVSETDVFDTIADKAPELLIKATHAKLQSWSSNDGGKSVSFYGGSPSDNWGNNVYVPAFALCRKQTIWPQAIEFYANNADEPEFALKILNDLRKSVIKHGVKENHKDRPLQFLDRGIKILKDRV